MKFTFQVFVSDSVSLRLLKATKDLLPYEKVRSSNVIGREDEPTLNLRLRIEGIAKKS